MNPVDWSMAQKEAGGGRDPIWGPSPADKEERSLVAAHQRRSPLYGSRFERRLRSLVPFPTACFPLPLTSLLPRTQLPFFSASFNFSSNPSIFITTPPLPWEIKIGGP